LFKIISCCRLLFFEGFGGGILTKDYPKSLFEQYVRPKMAKWRNGRWSHHSFASIHGLKKVPKYEAIFPTGWHEK
jgi:hypothetical protein